MSKISATNASDINAIEMTELSDAEMEAVTGGLAVTVGGLAITVVHPDMGISNKAMSILNAFVEDIFERVANEIKP